MAVGAIPPLFYVPHNQIASKSSCDLVVSEIFLLFRIKLRKWYKRCRGLLVLAQRFLHPRHIVPRAEFIGAMGEPPHRSKAQMGVESHAVAGQIGVVVIGIGDAGVEVLHILGLGDALQLGIQPLAQTLATNVLPQIDAGLHRPAVGGPFPKGAGIGVPQNFAVFHGHDIGIAPQGVGDAALKFLQRGNLVLKGDGGLFHIGA